MNEKDLAAKVLARLERWTAAHHMHHAGDLLPEPERPQCSHVHEPYVDSEALVREIRRLRDWLISEEES
jgi:hypothetical protein